MRRDYNKYTVMQDFLSTTVLLLICIYANILLLCLFLMQEHYKTLIELTQKTRQAYDEKWTKIREKLELQQKESKLTGMLALHTVMTQRLGDNCCIWCVHVGIHCSSVLILKHPSSTLQLYYVTSVAN